MGSVVSSLLFQPPTPPTYSQMPNYFWLYTSKGEKIPAFFINRNADLTLLFSHSNAEDLGMIYDWFMDFSRKLRVNVMSYDYTGYGLNDGTPTEEHCFADIEAAFAYLTDVVDIPPDQIVLYGRSLGSGPSTHLARRLSLQAAAKASTGKGRRRPPLRGLVLQSPLMSAYRVAFHFRWSMPGDNFCNIDKIGDVRCPVFVLHGSEDEVVPFWHGQQLYLATRKEWRYQPFWVKGAGHNNIEFLCRDDGRFHAKLREYFNFLRDRQRQEDAAEASLAAAAAATLEGGGGGGGQAAAAAAAPPKPPAAQLMS